MDITVEYLGNPPEGYFREPEVVARCKNCGEPLYEGWEVVEWEGYYFCDWWCLFKWLGAKEVTLGD